jgi:hypothetical protein
MPHPMARVHNNRQVRVIANDGHSVNIERIASIGAVDRYNPALAQHHLFVALREQILGGGEPLVDGGVRRAFEQHGLARSSCRHQQREVLHAARPNLQDVHIIGDQLHIVRV